MKTERTVVTMRYIGAKPSPRNYKEKIHMFEGGNGIVYEWWTKKTPPVAVGETVVMKASIEIVGGHPFITRPVFL